MAIELLTSTCHSVLFLIDLLIFGVLERRARMGGRPMTYWAAQRGNGYQDAGTFAQGMQNRWLVGDVEGGQQWKIPGQNGLQHWEMPGQNGRQQWEIPGQSDGVVR